MQLSLSPLSAWIRFPTSHVDATSRFVQPGVVLVQLAPPYRDDIRAMDTLQQYQILSASTHAKGRLADNLHSGGGGVQCVTQQEPVATWGMERQRVGAA